MNKVNYQPPLLTILITLISYSASAGLPKAVEIDRQKQRMMESLSSDDCQSAMNHLGRLEALQAELPQDLVFYVKGKCYYKLGEHKHAQASLEAFFNQVDSSHANYQKGLEIYNQIEDAREAFQKDLKMIQVGHRGQQFCYQMGKTFFDGDSDERKHRVCIKGFKMTTYEVTQRV
ncbi:MAG: hypothetical protein HOE44_03815, partial [Candidatus Marinimicrobia bacterium]|nr:hypothetical protein [Candidatus Neomarinimicrobiota bacterium]